MKPDTTRRSIPLQAAMLLATLCAGLAAAPAWADFAHAKEAYAAAQYDVALAELKPLAEAGDAKAQELLGRMYMNGQGTPVDKNQARDWLGRSADQGDGDAGRDLGYMAAKEIDWDTSMSSPTNKDLLTDSDGKLIAYRVHGLAIPIPHGYEGPTFKSTPTAGNAILFRRNDMKDQGVVFIMALIASSKYPELANINDDEARKAKCRALMNSTMQTLSTTTPEFRAGPEIDDTVAGIAAVRVSFSAKVGYGTDRVWIYFTTQGGRYYLLRIDQVSTQNDTLGTARTDLTGDVTGAFEAATFQPED